MAQPRSHPAYEPADVFRLVSSAPILWPGRVVRLGRDSLIDQCGRSSSAQVSVAELYHENSKLSTALLPELALTTVDVAALRSEYMLRRAVVARSAGGDDEQARPWKELLDRACARDLDRLYALEIRLVLDTSVFAYEPAACTLHLVKRLTGAQVEQFSQALVLTDPVAVNQPTAPSAVVLLVGCFTRNGILYGDRGYRRTLLEAGQFAGELERHAGLDGRTTLLRYEFEDHAMDQITEVDGVEQGVIVAVEFR